MEIWTPFMATRCSCCITQCWWSRLTHSALFTFIENIRLHFLSNDRLYLPCQKYLQGSVFAFPCGRRDRQSVYWDFFFFSCGVPFLTRSYFFFAALQEVLPHISCSHWLSTSCPVGSEKRCRYQVILYVNRTFLAQYTPQHLAWKEQK